MDHSYYKERISAYADNALPPYEQMAVQEHIESCAECREAFEKILKLTAWIDSEANLSGDEYFELQAQKIEARLGLVQTEVTPIGKKTWRGLGWKLTSVAASIALVGIVVYLSKDTVLQKSETPKVSAPAVTEEKKSDNIQTPENVGLNSIQPETTANRPALKDEMTPAVPEEKSAEGPTQTKKATALTEDQNYKTSPQMMAPADASPSTVASESDQKTKSIQESKPSSRDDVKLESAAGSQVESGSVQALKKRDASWPRPVQRVDDILKSVESVKVLSNGEVFIRGGRAGEAVYLVDSVTMPDSMHQSPDTSKPDALAYWRDVRDSLEREKRTSGVVSEVLSQTNQVVKNKRKTMAFAETLPVQRVTLAEAYFRIAKISRDSTEIARVTDSLKSIAADPKSPDHTTAIAYLDSLGVR